VYFSKIDLKLSGVARVLLWQYFSENASSPLAAVSTLTAIHVLYAVAAAAGCDDENAYYSCLIH